MYRTILLQKCC